MWADEEDEAMGYERWVRLRQIAAEVFDKSSLGL